MTKCPIDTFQYNPLICAKQSVRCFSVLGKTPVTFFLISRSKCLSDVVRHFLGRLVSPLRTGFSESFVKLPVNKRQARLIYFK
jgi:hypothetical protein